MRRPVIMICAAAVSGLLVGCGGTSSPDRPRSDRASIIDAAKTYFVFDPSPDRDEYCASYVELQKSDSPLHGELTSDANRTEARCRRFLPRYLRHVGHTGWRDAKIKRVEVERDRGHVLVTFRIRGRMTSRDARVGRVARGDWRILNAGYD
jgi:hypothetical protein